MDCLINYCNPTFFALGHLRPILNVTFICAELNNSIGFIKLLRYIDMSIFDFSIYGNIEKYRHFSIV